MKLLRRAAGRFAFQLGSREKELLAQILGLYPCIPAAYQPLSKNGTVGESTQRLLEEALADQRRENQKRAQALLAAPGPLKANPDGWLLSLRSAELEQLLQILNDVRVGSWISLGSPQPPLEVFDAKLAPHFWAMELAGHFQMFFLAALDDGGVQGGSAP
jgi:hypothetical protein